MTIALKEYLHKDGNTLFYFISNFDLVKSFITTIFFAFLGFGSTAQLDLNMDFSYDQLEELLGKARAQKDHRLLADVYFKLGQYEKDKFNNQKLAFEYFTRSRDYYKLVDDQNQLFEIERIIALRSYESGLNAEAITSLDNLLKDAQAIEDKNRMLRLYIDLALAHSGIGDTETELKFQQLALNMKELRLHPKMQRELYLKRMKSYVQINEWDSSLIMANRVLQLAIDSNDNEICCKAYLEKGKVYQKLKRPSDQLEALLEAKSFCGNKSFDENRLSLYAALSECYEEFEMFEEAYDNANKYSALNDSILNRERNNSINNLTYKFSVREKNKELRLSELELEYSKERNTQQQRALWVLGIGLAGLALFLYYTIRIYNQRIKANRLINQQRDEISKQRISKLEDDIKINSMQSMLEGQETERERIAKDLHDSLGGVLSTIKLHFDALQNKVSEVKNINEYQRAHAMIDAAVDEVRTISQNLQPSSLKNLGLIPAIKDLINRFDGSGYPEIDLQHYDFPTQLDQMTSLYIYRMVQELLHNSIKHAQASEIMIQLKQDEGELVVHFEDDGIGFDPKASRKEGMGMENLKGRANYLHGSITIDSIPGEGSSFLIHIPYDVSKVGKIKS